MLRGLQPGVQWWWWAPTAASRGSCTFGSSLILYLTACPHFSFLLTGVTRGQSVSLKNKQTRENCVRLKQHHLFSNTAGNLGTETDGSRTGGQCQRVNLIKWVFKRGLRGENGCEPRGGIVEGWGWMKMQKVYITYLHVTVPNERKNKSCLLEREWTQLVLWSKNIWRRGWFWLVWNSLLSWICMKLNRLRGSWGAGPA